MLLTQTIVVNSERLKICKYGHIQLFFLFRVFGTISYHCVFKLKIIWYGLMLLILPLFQNKIQNMK
jgi:hypothetical protein